MVKHLNIFYLLFSILVVGFTTACEEEDELTLAPTADAGADQTAGLGEVVTLSGAASSAAAGTSLTTFQWQITNAPSTSVANIDNPNQAVTTFTPDEAGAYTFRLTVTNDAGDTDSDDMTVTVNPGQTTFPIEVSDNITENTTWSKVAPAGQVDYRVTRSIRVDAQLTVEPGVRVVFVSNSGIEVQSSGAIIAVGTAGDKITFTGETEQRGFWRGIRIRSNNPLNELTHVVIRHGGSAGFDGADRRANLELTDNARLKLTNSELTDALGPGLRVQNSEATLHDFASNILTNNELPINAAAIHYHFLDAASDYSGNDDDYIESYNGTDPSADVTWQALNVPYRLVQNAIERVDGEVTIQAGARFIAAQNAGLEIAPNGSIVAAGTATDKITFEGETATRGYWRGIRILSNNPGNEMAHVVIRHGGSSGFDGANRLANLELSSSGRLKLTHSELTDADGPGLRVQNSNAVLPEFENNLFTDNEVPIVAAAIHYHSFDAASDYTGNDDDYIESYNGTDLDNDVTWQALNVPYRLAENTIETIAGAVTVAPGASFLGSPNAGLTVGPNGSLNAVGSSGSPITFLGEQDVAGYWRGIRFLSNNPSNVLTNVVVANGGSSGFDGANRLANLEVGSSGRLSVTSSTIRDSAGWGVFVQGNGNLTESGNSFSSNDSGNVGS